MAFFFNFIFFMFYILICKCDIYLLDVQKFFSIFFSTLSSKFQFFAFLKS